MGRYNKIFCEFQDGGSQGDGAQLLAKIFHRVLFGDWNDISKLKIIIIIIIIINCNYNNSSNKKNKIK